MRAEMTHRRTLLRLRDALADICDRKAHPPRITTGAAFIRDVLCRRYAGNARVGWRSARWSAGIGAASAIGSRRENCEK